MRWLLHIGRVLVLGLLASGLWAQGTVRESLSFTSKLLKRPARYSIYLPSGHDSSPHRRYPVVYLLHGYSDDDTAWIHFGDVAQTLDRAIAARDLPPMIVVMPDGGLSWFMNSADGSTPWGDFFIQEFIPYIEGNFQVRRFRQARAVVGLAMGGHGALLHAMKRPDLFGACAALSASVYPKAAMAGLSQERWDKVFGPVIGSGLAGEARLTAHFQAHNPLALAEGLKAQDLREVRWYLDCGDQDDLLGGNLALHQALKARGIPAALRVRGGGHAWSYWRSGLLPALEAVSGVFRND